MLSCTGSTITHSWEAPAWQSNVFPSVNWVCVCARACPLVTRTHKMESTFMFPIADGPVFHPLCPLPISPLSSHEGPPCLCGEQMRLTFVRRAWDESAVACSAAALNSVSSVRSISVPEEEDRREFLSVHSLHLLSQSCDLNFLFSFIYPFLSSFPFCPLNFIFFLTAFLFSPHSLTFPLVQCSIFFNFYPVCPTACALLTSVYPLLLSVCALWQNTGKLQSLRGNDGGHCPGSVISASELTTKNVIL